MLRFKKLQLKSPLSFIKISSYLKDQPFEFYLQEIKKKKTKIMGLKRDNFNNFKAFQNEKKKLTLPFLFIISYFRLTFRKKN